MNIALIILASILFGLLLGTWNGYRNGKIDGRMQSASMEKKSIELLIRALLDMEGNSFLRANRTVGDIRTFLSNSEKTNWIRSIRVRNKETVEEDTFQHS